MHHLPEQVSAAEVQAVPDAERKRCAVRGLERDREDGEFARIGDRGLDYVVAIRNLADTIDKELSKYVFPQTLTPPVGQGA